MPIHDWNQMPCGHFHQIRSPGNKSSVMALRQFVEKSLTSASYFAGLSKTAYVEVSAVGEDLPDMPVFLESKRYVRAPLQETYNTTWKLCPEEFRERVAGVGA